MRNGIRNYLQQSINATKNLISYKTETIEKVANTIISTYKNNGNIYICGNGGSGSIASHICSDFNKYVNEDLIKKINFICLNDCATLISAISNDLSYNDVFSYSIKGKITALDALIVLSGSGSSQNILNVCQYANTIGATTISLSSFKNSIVKDITNLSLSFDLDDMQIAEDLFLTCGHMLARLIKEDLSIK